MNSNTPEKKFWMSNHGLIAMITICIVLFAACYTCTWLFDKPNEAGDTAGLVNGLFSALAFACVIYAIFLQKHELELQRQELRDTRDELAAQKEEFKTQNDTLKRQRFENTFFNMMQLQQQITDNITYSYGYNKENPMWIHDSTLPRYTWAVVNLKGREVFREAFEEVPHEADDDTCYTGMRGLLANKGMTGYENNMTPTYFDHYFRHMYRIIKFIATSPLIKDEERYHYSSIVRAQLSRYELVWLYYNGLSNYGRQKFKPYIQTFSLLKNLRPELLVDGVQFNESYTDNAFTPRQ